MTSKRWGRRLGATTGAVLLITIAFYSGFEGWGEYADWIFKVLIVLVGGLTVTDMRKNDKN